MTAPVLALLAALASPPTNVHGPFGVGLILGEPSGVSGKLFLDERHALDLALDFSLRNDAFYVHGDYVLHLPGLLAGLSEGIWLAYVGVGGKLKVRDRKKDDDDLGVTVRVPLGVAWMPKTVPIDVFLEIVPGMRVLPETDPDFGAGLGVRWFF